MVSIWYVAVAFALLVQAVPSNVKADDQHIEPRDYSWSFFTSHFLGNIGGPRTHLSIGYNLYGYCIQGKKCYQYTSVEFQGCCNNVGCCPSGEWHAAGCYCSWKCRMKGGICRKNYCLPGERVSWGCWGYGCRCCIQDVLPVTEDCEGASACCGFPVGSGQFYQCCQQYRCCPVCDPPRCTLGNETFASGELMRSYPERCLQLRCEVEQKSVSPFFREQIVEITTHSSCGCCTLGGKLYDNGYLLTQDDYCIAVQCEDGKWINKGFFNSNCTICLIQDSLAVVITLDGTLGAISDLNCTYSALQNGTSYEPEWSIYVDFDPHPTIPGYVDRNSIIWNDSGEQFTCPGDDIQGCSFGPVTEFPTEVTGAGTLAFNMTLGGVEFNVIMGSNHVATLYNENILLLLAPLSMYDTLGGVCGSVFNGNQSDDLTTRDGGLATDFTTFAESWKTDPMCNSSVMTMMLREHSGLDNCESVSEDNLSLYNASCSEINAMHGGTDAMIDECMQMMCLCLELMEESCIDLFNDIATYESALEDLKKSPLELAILLQVPKL